MGSPPNQQYNSQSYNRYPNSQAYSGQVPDPRPSSQQYYVPPPKESKLATIIIILIILFAAGGLYFLVKDKLGFGAKTSSVDNISTTKQIISIPIIPQQKTSELVSLDSFSKPIHDEIRVYRQDGSEITELYSKDSLNYNGLNLSNFKLNMQIPNQYPA